jgi:thiol-disulfide isomerase/thioredoxin
MLSSDSSTPENVRSEPPIQRRPGGLILLWIAPLVALALIVVYGLFTRQPADQSDTAPQVGRPLADFTLSTLQGQPIHLAALRGKVVFINVWATWCPPCIEEMPVIQQLHERLQPRGLEVLAVSLDALGTQVVEPFVQSRRLTFPIVLDPKSSLQRLYRTTGVPESFIVDKKGLLVEKIIGPRDWVNSQMLALFERLLAAPLAENGSRG